MSFSIAMPLLVKLFGKNGASMFLIISNDYPVQYLETFIAGFFDGSYFFINKSSQRKTHV